MEIDIIRYNIVKIDLVILIHLFLLHEHEHEHTIVAIHISTETSTAFFVHEGSLQGHPSSHFLIYTDSYIH